MPYIVQICTILWQSKSVRVFTSQKNQVLKFTKISIRPRKYVINDASKVHSITVLLGHVKLSQFFNRNVT